MKPYDPRQWTSHLFDVTGSLVREIFVRVAANVTWSAIVVGLFLSGPDICRQLAIPSTAHALVGTALGLLLVFRTNSSYDRFWEGRKQWGGIVNECRNLARQSSVWLAEDRALMRDVVGWTIAFPVTVMNLLQKSYKYPAILSEFPPAERQRVEGSVHQPLAVTRMITERLLVARERGLIDGMQLNALDQNVQLLIDYCGACERIRSTPLPFAYAVHLRRVLIAYCFTLPLALVKDFGWATVPTTLLIAYSMFGIEEIGVEIEDPFEGTLNDLPLETICEKIESALAEIRNETE